MAAELDTLEYYIKFPNPNFVYNRCDDDYVFIINEKRIPVILLFGWAGCQDRYLAKYSQIYEDKGLITLRYTAPVKCLFWKRYQMITIGERLVKLLLDLNFDTHPIIVHCFSNGGAFLYQSFIMALDKSPKKMEIKGVIFDSAPGKRRILRLFRAIQVILGGNRLYNLPMSILMTVFVSMVWLYEIVASWFKSDRIYQSNLLENLKDEKNQWPQHFIYSKSDDLIPYTDVEYFAAHRERLGVRVTRMRYDISPHVKHYTENRDSYLSSIYGFINGCLNGGGGNGGSTD